MKLRASEEDNPHKCEIDASGNMPAFQVGFVGSIPTSRSKFKSKEEDMEYSTPFNLKEELKKINEKAKLIIDKKIRTAMIEQETKDVQDYSDMLRKMSKFVNAKNKNGQHPSGLR